MVKACPCIGCQERRPGCHGHCPEKAAWDDFRKGMKRWLYLQRELEEAPKKIRREGRRVRRMERMARAKKR